MVVHQYWRSRKKLSIIWRNLIGLPMPLLADTKDFLHRALSGLRQWRQWDFRKNQHRRTKKTAQLDRRVQSPLVGDACVDASIEKPLIFVSACISQELTGYWKYNGGIKEFNCLVKLLRSKGYEAYIVTYDGQDVPWLVDHQPCISLAAFEAKLLVSSNVRCITSWAEARAFIQGCQKLYFWDMALTATDQVHYYLLADLYRRKIQKVAGVSGTIQAWHMAHFNRLCVRLPNLVDDAIWFPIAEQRIPHRIGYLDEGPRTEGYIQIIQDIISRHSLNLEFFKFSGPEDEMVSGMRSCEVFLTMNCAEDMFWGEGGPLPPLEALAVGCVPITFDIFGPREIIQSNFSGVIVPRDRPDLMAEALANTYLIPGELERLRNNGMALFQSCHTMEARWPFVVDFLDL
jgi:glycosyltransferase involved in cell wall biosynthesis